MKKLLIQPPRPWAGRATAGRHPDGAGCRRALVHKTAFNHPFGRAAPGETGLLGAAAAPAVIITQLGASLDHEIAASAISGRLWAGTCGRIAGCPTVL
jgi:hypothetical protein